MSPAQADMLFFEYAKTLPMYGLDLHPAKVCVIILIPIIYLVFDKMNCVHNKRCICVLFDVFIGF